MQKAAKNHDDQVDQREEVRRLGVEPGLPARWSALAAAGSSALVGAEEVGSFVRLLQHLLRLLMHEQKCDLLCMILCSSSSSGESRVGVVVGWRGGCASLSPGALILIEHWEGTAWQPGDDASRLGRSQQFF